MVFAICAVLAASLTWGMYRHTYPLNLERLRERAMGIAATVALQFDASDLEELKTYRDVSKPVSKKVVDMLNDIREQNPCVKYAYIMRPTENPYYWKLVTDADSYPLLPFVDLDGDGLLNDQIAPGHMWLDERPKESAKVHGLLKPTADQHAH